MSLTHSFTATLDELKPALMEMARKAGAQLPETAERVFVQFEMPQLSPYNNVAFQGNTPLGVRLFWYGP